MKNGCPGGAMMTPIEASEYERVCRAQLAAAIVALVDSAKTEEARRALIGILAPRMVKLLQEDTADKVAADLLADVEL